MLLINNDQHSAQLIMLDLPPCHRIILWLVWTWERELHAQSCVAALPAFMNEERGVARWV